MTPTPWRSEIEDTPVARLAWDLQGCYRFEYPPHLAVEALALEFAQRYGFSPPVFYDDGSRVLEELGIKVDPPGVPRLPKGHSGYWSGQVVTGRFLIQTNERDAETRRTLSLFHEFYEILRAYLHAFDCAPFPPGMDKGQYVPERMARRFAAALTMPRPFVQSFLLENGLDIPLLKERTDRSTGCTVRRLRELLSGGGPIPVSRKERLAILEAAVQLSEGSARWPQGAILGNGASPLADMHPDDAPILGEAIPILALGFALKQKFVQSDNPRMVCVEHTRSRHFSIRRNEYGSRDFVLPRKKEHWRFGSWVEAVLEAEAPVFARRITGFDLLGQRDLCGLAEPEWDRRRKRERLAGVTFYATPISFAPYWLPCVERLECRILDEVVGFAGAPVKTRRRRARHGDMIDVRSCTTRGGEEREVEVFAPLRHRDRNDDCGMEGETDLTSQQLGLVYVEGDSLLLLPYR